MGTNGIQMQHISMLHKIGRSLPTTNFEQVRPLGDEPMWLPARVKSV